VSLIYARGHLFIGYSKDTLGDLSQGGGGIPGEVLTHCANLAEIEWKSASNDRKECRYGIVNLITSRGHL